jgi:hypothetical protein
MTSLKIKTPEDAFEKLNEFLNKIQKDLDQKRLVLQNLTELNIIQKDNLANMYSAKIIRLDAYKQVLKDFKQSSQLILDYKGEVEHFTKRVAELRIKIKVTTLQAQAQIGKLYRFK